MLPSQDKTYSPKVDKFFDRKKDDISTNKPQVLEPPPKAVKQFL